MVKYSKSPIPINGYTLYWKQIVPEERYKIMRDEAGRKVMVSLISYEKHNGKYDEITLMIIYLDDNSCRIYEPLLFKRKSITSFNTIYELCKTGDYEEFKLNKEDK